MQLLVLTLSALLAAPANGNGCPDPRKWPGHVVYDNATSAFYRPKGRRILGVLGAADSRAVAKFGPLVTPLFEQLKSTETLSLMSGGCIGLMGIGSSFCAKGPLGEMCNSYDGFWRADLTATDNTSCIGLCETVHHAKTHLMATNALEEEIMTGGSSVGFGDAFLLQPGGVGTSRELFDILQANFEYGNVNKPVFCLNVGGGFYDGIVSWLQNLFSTQLLAPYPGSKGSSFFISSDVSELAAAIDDWALDGRLPEKLRLENILNRSQPMIV